VHLGIDEPGAEIPRSREPKNPIPHIPLPFREVIADMIAVKPPEKAPTKKKRSKMAAR
jgi:hypothetical protein